MRRAILDAVRRSAGTRATFNVAHLMISGDHAFVRAGEVVRDGDALQEIDLFVEALLRRTRPKANRWRAIALWNLGTERGTEHDAFVRLVRRHLRDGTIPVDLLPEDLRPPGPA